MVELALALIGADYEFARTGLGKGAKHADPYLAINPTGTRVVWRTHFGA